MLPTHEKAIDASQSEIIFNNVTLFVAFHFATRPRQVDGVDDLPFFD